MEKQTPAEEKERETKKEREREAAWANVGHFKSEFQEIKAFFSQLHFHELKRKKLAQAYRVQI